MNATAEIITIGDEILYGHIVDTNSQWIAATLSDTGIKVVRSTTVGDVVESIMNALKEASRRADIILITGGLGPTRDDLTKECLARFFNCDMQLHEEALAEVSNFFERRGRELTKLNRQQAVLPVCCTKITNRVGTAPGMWFDHEGKVFVSMPGVPGEMKLMMQESIVPRLRDRFKLPAIHHLTIKTVGIGESFLADKISEWEDALPPHIRLAYLPGYGEVKLRLTAIGDRAALADEMHAQADRLRDYAGPYIYGRDDDTLEGVVGQLLKHKNYTVGCAESCTGGYLSHRFTRVPGSSEYFKGSIIAYANEVKERELGVPKEILVRKSRGPWPKAFAGGSKRISE
jgi:nicotinamide-nucleotide amidase